MVKAMKTNNYASNKLSRNFKTSKPGEHLLTDITYIFYGKDRKLCYCSTIKDASTNEILAKEYSESLEIKFVLDTVSQLRKCKFIDFNKCVIHSDQGVHYTSIAFISLLSELSIARSMSRRGNCWDNAPQESFFGHMKDELHLEECESYEAVCNELNDYFDYSIRQPRARRPRSQCHPLRYECQRIRSSTLHPSQIGYNTLSIR